MSKTELMNIAKKKKLSNDEKLFLLLNSKKQISKNETVFHYLVRKGYSDLDFLSQLVDVDEILNVNVKGENPFYSNLLGRHTNENLLLWIIEKATQYNVIEEMLNNNKFEITKVIQVYKYSYDNIINVIHYLSDSGFLSNSAVKINSNISLNTFQLLENMLFQNRLDFTNNMTLETLINGYLSNYTSIELIQYLIKEYEILNNYNKTKIIEIILNSIAFQTRHIQINLDTLLNCIQINLAPDLKDTKIWLSNMRDIQLCNTENKKYFDDIKIWLQ